MSLPLRLCQERGCAIIRTWLSPRCFSSLPPFRTLENDPRNHKRDHIGKFYSIPKEITSTIFNHGGLPAKFKEQCKTFTETCFMIREPGLEIIDYMKRSDYSRPPNKYLMYGELGSGKSLTLAHILHYASLSNFILVHVPWASEWIRRVTKWKEMVNSPTREGFVDLPLDSAAWLVHFKSQNIRLLKELDLRITNEYVWSKRETSEIGSPLLDMVEFGINRIKYASEIMVAIGRELKILSTQNKCKTLVAVDGFNVFFIPVTPIKTDTRRKIPPSDLTIRIPFLEFLKNDWCNGSIVLTADRHAYTEPSRQESNYPHYLLGKEGFESIDPFVPIEVGPYTELQFTSAADYYRDRLWLRGSQDLQNELEFTSGKNPFKFMEMCAPL